MPVETGHHRGAAELLLLWGGWVVGPLAWGLHLMGSYLLVGWVCRTGGYWALHGVTIGTVLLALAGALLARRAWTIAGRRWPASADEASNRFLAVGGMLVSLLSALVILAEGIPNFILDACL